ncbi:stage II sporulation protein E [Natranaerovirga hydrolytica]|uniref:Stage II sporulation protein E n=1 Tax=Natranaerovirga hydrolytica TaxID=680378 RepID=A0A4R1M6J5_9FIRM|nr:stage II sporulation protein E [Natranaerovirga hydrolytica]TCK87858.1 stage II sporulation protein E [Natranaerovirga hydrolytica]
MDVYENTLLEKQPQSSKRRKPPIHLEKTAKAYTKKILMSFLAFILSSITIFQINPIILAYYAVMYLDKKSRVFIFISTIVGLITFANTIDFIKYFTIIMIMLTISTYLEIRHKKMSLTKISLIAGISTFGIGAFFNFIQSQEMHYIALSLFESIIVITLIFIYNKSISYLLNSEKKESLSNELIISLAILLATVIIGITNIEVFNFSFKEIGIFFSLLYFGYCFGVGASSVVGIVIGTVLASVGVYEPSVIGALGVIGLVSGLFKEIGKIGTSIGLAMGTILVGYYFVPDLLLYDTTRALIISILMFLFMPKQWIVQLNKEKVTISKDDYKIKFQQITNERLNQFATSFKKLSETFSALSDKKEGLSQEDVNKIFDEVAEKVCKNCSMCSLCWKKEFYDTYKAAFSILSAAEKKGKIHKNDVPKDFYDKCIKLDEFVSTTNRLFELFKINLSWHNRIIESRELVSEQLMGVSNIIENFSKEMYSDIGMEKQLEKRIEMELRKYPIKIKNTMVIENQNKRRDVYITVKVLNQNMLPSKELATGISKVLGKKMKLCENAKLTISEEYVTIKYVEEKLFRTIQGLAKSTKIGEKVSGDNFSFLELQNGQTILSLSDGMGTGLKACKESEAAIELLEQFMEAGFDKKTAIKMINSVLVLKSNEHSFSTLDMSVMDLHTGLCEFIKIGAAPTFIKRENSVETIKSTTLPVGMLNKVDFDTTTKKLYEGDLIIMVTDGIVDVDEEAIEKEIWIEKTLREINSKNPQEIADYLLEKAQDKSQALVGDDMTVLVSRIWKK